jgi:hypothetical protein
MKMAPRHDGDRARSLLQVEPEMFGVEGDGAVDIFDLN